MVYELDSWEQLAFYGISSVNYIPGLYKVWLCFNLFYFTLILVVKLAISTMKWESRSFFILTMRVPNCHSHEVLLPVQK